MSKIQYKKPKTVGMLERENEKLRKALAAMMTCMNGTCADCVACEETDTEGIFLCRFDQWLEELGIATQGEVDE